MKRVLSCDGGGIRGLVAAKFLADNPHLHTNTDLFVGTSTGGLIALALAAGLSPQNIVELYRQRGPEIFKKRLFAYPLLRERYSAKGIESALRAVFQDKPLSSIAVDKEVLITWTDYDPEVPEHALQFFRKDSGITFFDAARATSAAPTYFRPYTLGEKTHMDGGCVANNPADCAFVEAFSRWPGERVHIVSIGSGIGPKRNPERKQKRVTRMPFTYADEVLRSSIAGNVGKVHTLLKRLSEVFAATSSEPMFIYDRYDFYLGRDIQMDDVRPETLDYLEVRASRKYVLHNDKAMAFTNAAEGVA